MRMAIRSRLARSARSSTEARTRLGLFPRRGEDGGSLPRRLVPFRRPRGDDREWVPAVVDRKKDMIKTGGENVASREVEEVIYQLGRRRGGGLRHRPSSLDRGGHRGRDPQAGANVTVEGIQAHIKDKLAGYKRPKYVVIAGELPKNPSGKVLKRELRRHARTLLTRTERNHQRCRPDPGLTLSAAEADDRPSRRQCRNIQVGRPHVGPVTGTARWSATRSAV